MRELILLLVTCSVLLTACNGKGEDKVKGTIEEKVEEHTPAPSPIVEPVTATASEEAPTITFKGENIGQALLDGEYASIYKQLSVDFKKDVSEAQLKEAVAGFSEGVVEWRANSHLQINGGSYLTWTDQEGKKGLVVTMDQDEVITGLRLMPLTSFPDTDHAQTKQAYRLPFKGEWYVFWGGEDVLSNYHYELASQRYAYDIVQVKDGYTYKGDMTKNASYYAFGQDIVAPQDGKVVHIVSDIPDNEPVGVMNEEHPAGNVVVIDHGNGEFSFLAHLQKGSVKVKVGDEVKQGDLLGLCGNSGNSSEPHLHFQVSDQKELFDGASIRVQWENSLVLRQGETVIAE